MRNPVSTYRLQLHKEFTFDDLERDLFYLQALGIKTIYASPVFRSVLGSVHGYDGTDPNEINPEIGTAEQLKKISALLKEKGIYWLQDIVPNHMAFHHDNKWLMDVLKKGQVSNYFSYFDIIRDPQDSRLIAPFLGRPLEEAIRKNELKIICRNDDFLFQYFDNYFPIKEESHKEIFALHEDPETAVRTLNKDFQHLLQLVNDQHYKLVQWQETDQRMGYRRFFTVNGLICLNIQHKEVFNAVHRLSLELLRENIFQGLRIDHIDGLYEPENYLRMLRAAAGTDAYIVVEKILEPGEKLPESWPIQGNTGYDFLGLVNNLFTDKKSEEAFSIFYDRLTDDQRTVDEHIYEKKSLILYRYMAGELDYLYSLFKELAAGYPAAKQIPEEEQKDVIAEFLIQCPVYRFYGNTFPLEENERINVKKVISRIKEFPHHYRAAALLDHILTADVKNNDEAQEKKTLHFYKRCMQFSGPLMAKGVEDTLMYTYNRFTGHNEVGDSPQATGISADEFHHHMFERQQDWPLSLNATSTHDTKRGEDLRARLNVLSDLSKEWLAKVKEWQQLNAHLKTNNAPDANEEYFIYQALAGAYPMPGSDATDFKERLLAYIPKALREAKLHSGWDKPDENYEKAVAEFAIRLNQQTNFWESFRGFHHKIADYGIINSLSQLILKHTCPGIPDTYQGTELWDLSFVDPDNRRSVDYTIREQYLNEVNSQKDDPELITRLWEERHTGKIKLYLLQKLLQERLQQPAVFEKGSYIPLQVTGKYKSHVFAFARKFRQTWYVIAVPLHPAQIINHEQIGVFDWKDTQLILPEGLPPEWKHLLYPSGGKTETKILVNELFLPLPFAVLKFQQPVNNRSAGILMAVSSLPSPFGTGDLGPAAKAFADFLNRSDQKLWQLLPLNPVDAANDYSPYSSVSAMAGNTLLISPELLQEEGLLEAADLKKYMLPETAKSDYAKAAEIKNILFEKAFSTYKKGNFNVLQKDFHTFCEKEGYWLNDFARYLILRKQHAAPWYQWPEPYRKRDAESLDALNNQWPEEMEYIKWLQFIFQRQWEQLKEYCNDLQIRLFGDLPFYLSHDSAEVWANPGIFSLDTNGLIKGIAGVPPDYFSETGQLWGMPTYNWEALKEQNYNWWTGRLRKNLQLFDLVRIDHFRALAEYWEVPAGEKTAVNGEWKTGPREEFFNTIKQALGDLPFIAEDLGDNMEKVYTLRDAVKLPGMKVLQFGFGENLPVAVDIPHNFTSNCIVYTGTHDNNTTRGWYEQETTKEDRKRLEQYTGKKITEKNVQEALINMAYASVANTVVIPMQDLLGLDAAARMNTPGKGKDNWRWRITIRQLHDPALEKKLRDLTCFYNRL